MATWRKVVGCNGTWPLYLDRDDFNTKFGRFSIQAMSKDEQEWERMISLLLKALKECLPGAAVSAYRVRLHAYGVEDSNRVKSITEELRTKLQDLRLITAGCFPLNGSLRISGPGLVRGSDLDFGIPVQILHEDFFLTQLLPGEILDLEIKVEWGKGEVRASDLVVQNLPRGWSSLDRNHSPVRKMKTNRVYFEIATDGSITPDDAVRRVSFKLPPPPKVG